MSKEISNRRNGNSAQRYGYGRIGDDNLWFNAAMLSAAGTGVAGVLTLLTGILSIGFLFGLFSTLFVFGVFGTSLTGGMVAKQVFIDKKKK